MVKTIGLPWRQRCEGALLGIRATLPKGVFMATSHNSGHTAMPSYAKIWQSRNLHDRQPLSEIAGGMLNKKGGEIKCITATKIR